MVGEGTPAILVTFLLAIVGYVGLTAVVLASLGREVPLLLWRSAAAVVLVHVAMVWAFRYGWKFDLAVRNGTVGFLLFHGALALVLASTIVREPARKLLIRIAFVVVSVGALGATSRYDVVAAYRIPVIVCAAAGGVGLGWTLALALRSRAATY